MGADPLTIALIAASGAGAVSQISASQAQAKAQVREAEAQAAERRRTTRRQEAAARNSFLASGVASLTGTPSLVSEEIFATGRADIQNILRAGQAQARSTFTSGLAGGLGSLGGTALSTDLFGLSGSSPSGFASGVSKAAPRRGKV